jgi:hypothetical protein
MWEDAQSFQTFPDKATHSPRLFFYNSPRPLSLFHIGFATKQETQAIVACCLLSNSVRSTGQDNTSVSLSNVTKHVGSYLMSHYSQPRLHMANDGLSSLRLEKNLKYFPGLVITTGF